MLLSDAIILIALACVVVGLVGFVWNVRAGIKARMVAVVSPAAVQTGALSLEDRKLYERALVLIRENRISDGAKIFEELGLIREAATVLERLGLVHEAAGVYLRRKRYHRAGEVYARHRMWEQAGNSYLLAASGVNGALPGHSRRLSGVENSSVSDPLAVDRIDMKSAWHYGQR